ncbi:sulfotransferase [Spirulina sp. CS-785/01]|uniref:tetratricopeptide repeat-containing sulfotransferase family protein n=1 Tax=Spirulina sp. CS-785/01 TaxID=3021716 RepID=UPI00232B30B9|nr:sulfotransferase [Spirulina sp. CS-785/01]MDB9315602.1 sulfotransferase [Spirulina sp. CS-785/01]
MRETQKQRLIDHYRQVLKINPNSYSLYDKIAHLYDEMGEFELALQVCKMALRQNLEWELSILQSLLEKMGLIYQGSQMLQYTLGVETVKKNFASESDQLNSMTPTKYKDTEILELFRQGKTVKAIHICFALIENNPALTWPHSLLNSSLRLDQIEIPDLDNFICFYEQILQHPSVSPDAYAVMGNVFTKQGKITEAIAAFKTGMSQKVYFNKYDPHYYRDRPKVPRVDFLIIGIGKGGTSAVYRYLSEHPKILCPFQKELHFFNSNFELGLEWYLAQFPPLPIGGSFQTGEATPWYLVSHGVADKVHQTFPKIKLIVLLRHPIDRAISQYYMLSRMGLENRSLEVAITSEINYLSQLTDSDNLLTQYWQTERGYLWFSLYIYFIQEWMALFSSEQFLILRSEDLYHNTAQTLRQVYDFLEIPDYPLNSYPKYNASSYPQISDELYQKLADFFRPHNRQLEDYLGRKFFWE